MAKNILIAPSTYDETTYKPVQEILERRGYPAIVYRGDRVIAGEDSMRLRISADGELSVGYDNESIAPQDLGAAWFRKVGNVDIVNVPDGQRAKRMHLNNEIRKQHGTLWSLYPEDLWLNPPDRNHHAQKKLGQLILAQSLGFSIPETIMSSDWNYVESELRPEISPMIVKMVHGIISDEEKTKGLYTTPIDSSVINDIRDDTVPFPGIYQPFIGKTREWRVTVVGDTVFPGAIYTDETAKDDWRKHQGSNAVWLKAEAFPDEAAEKCLNFLGAMGLKFGAFDFIETSDGELVFLECNPNGQYGWIEEELGFPISEAIADELITIAISRDSIH